MALTKRSPLDTEDERSSYRSEFRYGSFDRVVRLPAGTSEENVTATYRDGILEVRLPVDDGAAAAKRVAVSKLLMPR